MIIETPNKEKTEQDRLLIAAYKIDPHVGRFIDEVLPRAQFSKAIHDLRLYRADLYEKLQKCIDGIESAHMQRTKADTLKSLKKELWEVVQESYKTYSCDTGFTRDKSVCKAVTVYIKGTKPKKRWPSELLKLQDKLANKVDSKRKWTFSFDSRVFTADLNQEEIDALRKDDSVYRIIEEPEVRIMYGEYAPYPAFNAATENVDWGTSKINPSYAWAKGIKGQGVKVCVIDTGVDMNHIDLSGRYKGGYNFVGGNDTPMDDHSHGTHCSGIVCGSENAIGYTGVAPLADLYATKVLNSKGSGATADVAAGIDWGVVNGMDILSLSLGSYQSCSGVMADACNNAWNQGLVIVASSGNSGADCSELGCVGFPGNCSSVIAVGSIDKDEYRSGFSSYGPEMEIIAPGEGITSSWLVGHDVYEDGVHIVGSSWYWMNGTSMSCPQVSGACALIKCWYPAATNYQIRQWLRDNTKDL